MPEIDNQVIRGAQKGEHPAIAQIYETYQLSVYRYLYYRVGDRHTAEDLTSEVFLRMLRGLGSYQPSNEPFGAWLFRIARNLAIDHYRARGRRNETQLEEEDMNLASYQANPAMAVEAALTSESLHQALDRLPVDQRDVIILRFVAELSIAEAARALNRSEDAIKGLQRRSLTALQRILIELEAPHA
jgi:RNA polymerase sigma-70 factor (ECF subfamily)